VYSAVDGSLRASSGSVATISAGAAGTTLADIASLRLVGTVNPDLRIESDH
jgi:hypothetical protein